MLPRSLYFLFTAGIFMLASSAFAEGESKAAKSVEVWIRVVDKVAGQPHLLKTETGSVAIYQTLSVMPHRCSVNNDGEFAALLEIYDQPPSGSVEEIFSGWMFSASVSLTSIEHQFYDVSLVKCAPRKEKADEKADKKENG